MKRFHSLRRVWKHRAAPLVAALAMLLSITAATGSAAALYIVTGVEDSAIVLDSTAKAPKITSPVIDLSTGSSAAVTLHAGQTVVIRRDDSSITVETRKETVSRLLERLNILLSPLEMVAVDVSTSPIEITIGEEIIHYDRVEEPVEPETVRVPTDELPVGTERVAVEGQAGVRTSIYEVIWSNGKELSRQLVEELDSTAVDTVVEYGTAPQGAEPVKEVLTNADGSGTLVLESGARLNFSAVKTMTATAYTAGHGGAGHRTALGTSLRVGVVAVNKNTIPLRSKLYVVANGGVVYGPAVAEDTGVRSDVIDLYMDSYSECIQFGRRGCTVYILED